MRPSTLDDLKLNHITEQLHKLGYHSTDGKTYEELKFLLTIERYKAINHDSAENTWFE